MSIAFHPTKLIFIHFPKQVQLFALRSQTRIPTLLTAKLKLSDDRVLEGSIKDISLTGIMFDVRGEQQDEMKAFMKDHFIDPSALGITVE